MHFYLDPRKSIKMPFRIALIATFAGIHLKIADDLIF